MFRSILAAFSTYSVIPVPSFELKGEDTKYSLCAFPLIGLVIGALIIGGYRLLVFLNAGTVLIAGFMTLLPLAVTGGIHMDGYMDVKDALCSYGDREKRLAILKDPHAGAFAVIYAICHILALFVLWHELITRISAGEAGINLMYAVCFGFVVSRILSGLAAVTLKNAKAAGMLYKLSSAQDKKCRYILAAAFIVTTAVMLFILKLTALLTLVPAAVMFAYYRHVSYTKFGGITGDLAGWFLQKCELFTLFCVTTFAVALPFI